MFTVEFWIGVIGTVVAINLCIWIRNKFFHEGVLEIDRSHRDADRWRFVVKIEPETLYKKKYITLKLDKNADLSHE